MISYDYIHMIVVFCAPEIQCLKVPPEGKNTALMKERCLSFKKPDNHSKDMKTSSSTVK